MEREITYRKAKFESQGTFEHQEAVTLACQGRLKEAAQLWDRALILARQGRFLEQAALFQGARACGMRSLGFAQRRKRTRRQRCPFTEGGTPIMGLR